MRLFLAAFTLLLISLAYVPQPKSTAQQIKNNPDHKTGTTPTEAVDKAPRPDPGKQERQVQQSGDQNPSIAINKLPPVTMQKDRWDKLYIALTLFLVLVGGATFGAILVQAIQTKHAARAARDSAEALKNAERAWVMIDIDWCIGRSEKERLQTPDGDLTNIVIALTSRNEGRTPAWISEKRACVVVAKDLPAHPDFSQVDVVQTDVEALGVRCSQGERRLCLLQCTKRSEHGVETPRDELRDIFGGLRHSGTPDRSKQKVNAPPRSRGNIIPF